jgi:hypothetical protein
VLTITSLLIYFIEMYFFDDRTHINHSSTVLAMVCY